MSKGQHCFLDLIEFSSFQSNWCHPSVRSIELVNSHHFSDNHYYQNFKLWKKKKGKKNHYKCIHFTLPQLNIVFRVKNYRIFLNYFCVLFFIQWRLLISAESLASKHKTHNLKDLTESQFMLLFSSSVMFRKK